ncbi:MAG: hypothetical protein ACYTDX_04130, partial [Planctomycetota bacterium]
MTARLAACLPLIAALLVPGGASPSTLPGEDLPTRDAALNLDVMTRLRWATVTTSPILRGRIGSAFDGKSRTSVTLGGERITWVEATFREPVSIHHASISFGGASEHRWDLLVGDDPDRLRTVIERETVPAGAWSKPKRFYPPLRVRVLRLEMQRHGGGPVDLAEVALMSRQSPRRVSIEAPAKDLVPGGSLPVQAWITYDGGYRDSGSLGLTVEVEPKGPVRTRDTPMDTRTAAVLSYVEEGKVQARAVLEGGTTRIESRPLEIVATRARRLDWSITHIERLPRDHEPQPG